MNYNQDISDTKRTKGPVISNIAIVVLHFITIFESNLSLQIPRKDKLLSIEGKNFKIH